jgi:class 3 adenylate cyclase
MGAQGGRSSRSFIENVLGGGQSTRSGLYHAFSTIPVTPRPNPPAATTASQIREAEERFQKRLTKIREILPIKLGRSVPDDGDLMLGDARRLKLAVLFVDICKFSEIPSVEDSEQDEVLARLNLFMAEMLWIVRKHGGEFEKNTGDGLMAYFKNGSEHESTRCAVDAAVTMHCYNDQVISPQFTQFGIPKIRFRVGIETGTVTVANVGIAGGTHRSLVAIGITANVACKLMSLMPDGGIVIGNYARSLLPQEWQKETSFIGPLPGYVLRRDSTTPFPAWELKYRVPSSSLALNLVPMFGQR